MDFPCISFYPMWVPDRGVWVSDSQQPFVEHQRMSPDVLYMKEKQALVIPCRVTHPNITTTLVKVSAGKTPEIQRHSLLILLIFYFWFRSQLSIFAHFILSVFHPLFLSATSHRSLRITTCPSSFFPSQQDSIQLFLTLQIICHIVLILAAIARWRVCPFVCVRRRICVKVCADVFVSAGA